MNVSSTARVLPQHQTLEVGQALDRIENMLAKAVEPEYFLVLGPPDRLTD